MAVVRERKRAMVKDLVEVHEKRFAANRVELIRGQGIFTGPRTLLVELEDGGSRLLAAKLVIEAPDRGQPSPIFLACVRRSR